MFGRSQPPAPSREELEERLDSMRPGAEPQPFEEGEVTGLIDLALERLQIAQQSTASHLEAATRRLLDEAELTRELARRLTKPPP